MTRHNLPMSERIYPRLAIESEDSCWAWTGSIDSHGYGKMKVAGHAVAVHPIVYRLWYGEAPDGHVIGHKCHDEAVAAGECLGGRGCLHRRCSNPDHLEAQTISENTKRGHAGMRGDRRKAVLPSD